MSKRSLGKNWKGTTTEEKRAFVSAFKALIQNSYFTKMEQYTDEKIKYDKEKITGKSSVVKDACHYKQRHGDPDRLPHEAEQKERMDGL